MKLPKPLQLLWDGWMKLSHFIGLIMSSIILTVLWVVVFGMYAVVIKIVKIFGKPPKQTTYWWDVSQEHSDFQHQF